MTRPHRSEGDNTVTRTRWTAQPDTPDQLAEEVQAARTHVDRARRAVAAGRDGAAAVHAAEHRLHVALNRLDAARDQGDDAA